MMTSVVVSTWNRAPALSRLLGSLAHLDTPGFEVVVVNGPSTDDTAAVLAGWADRIKVRNCPRANLSLSRNIGIAAAAGDLVAFIDDDAIPADRGWLDRLVAPLAADPDGRIGAVGGMVLPRDSSWPEFTAGWVSDYAELATGDPDPAEGSGRWCARVSGNNMAFRRAALVAVGGFDEHLAYYLDEADVCRRLAQAGYATAHVPDATVRHYPADSPSGPAGIRNRRLIARSDAYFAMKHGRDALPRRILGTLRRAPHKHFVEELPDLVTQGRISADDVPGLGQACRRGALEGLALGLLLPRRTRLGTTPPPGWRDFRPVPAGGRLSVALVSRRLPPDPHAGGVGRYTWDLARGLYERGNRVTVVTESAATVRREGLDFEVAGVRPAEVPPGFGTMPVLADNLAFAAAVPGVLDGCSRQAGGFDVVHATNWGVEGFGVAASARWPMALMLVTPLESVIAAEGWSIDADLSANIALDQWTIAHADRILAPSAGVVGRYAGRDGWRDRPVHPVALGTAPPIGTGGRRAVAGRRLLFVGRHERRKGIDVLLDVLPRVLERHPDWHCDLVGEDRPDVATGRTWAEEFVAAHVTAPWLARVTFHGPVTDDALPAFYARADLFAAPSRFESFGLIYLEAMRHGVPVVGTIVGGVPEVVSEGVDGVLVPPGDPVVLERALDALMTDDARRIRMGARAAETARSTGSHLAMADRMLAAYDAAIAAHGRARDGERTDLDFGPDDHPGREPIDAATVFERARSILDRLRRSAKEPVEGEAAAGPSQAMLPTGRPADLGSAIDLALADGDGQKATALAGRAFEAAPDGSALRLVAAALLLRSPASPAAEPVGWRDWFAASVAGLPVRLVSAAVQAVRAGRDATAVVLLEACVDRLESDPTVRAQARYHLGSALKRVGRPAEALARLDDLHRTDRGRLAPAVQGALSFHLGELHLDAGRPDVAVRHFETCLSLNSGHQRARALADGLRTGKAVA